jgi:hypothetical protein
MDFTLRKIVESGYGHGLATTTSRIRWEAVRLDGTVLTSGRTKAEAAANASHVLEEAASMRRATQAADQT